MRVVTPFGFGETVGLKEKEILVNQGPITVILDKPFLNQNQVRLEKGEVFLFSDWAVIKVLNITGHGWFSNLQFYNSKADAETMLVLPTPPDETTFFLNLQSGRFGVNRHLGILAQYSLILKPWVDRWAKERTETFKYISEAREAFRKEKNSISGTSGGIEVVVHLDSEGGGNILGFYLVVPSPPGVIFEKEFELKLHEDS
jgi:hypothetical protein